MCCFYQAGKANVGVQFLVDQDGSIYQITPDNYFNRHCIGLNHCAIGFENIGMGDITEAGLRGEPQDNVQLTLAQLKSNVALIRYLKKNILKLRSLLVIRSIDNWKILRIPGISISTKAILTTDQKI